MFPKSDHEHVLNMSFHNYMYAETCSSENKVDHFFIRMFKKKTSYQITFLWFCMHLQNVL